MQWDLFCRVIDNFGDIGVCWRLAADLAARGETVRLWVDDASALRFMAPQGAPGVMVQPWPTDSADPPPGDVVIEAFGCEPPARFVQRMANSARPPLWINLEYLSAEPYVERSHRLPSPQLSGPGRGLTKWFFYPGFTPATGGLIREPGLDHARNSFDRDGWLHAHGVTRRAPERVVSLFCYPNPQLPQLLESLAGEPTWLLLTPGIELPVQPPANVRTHRLPYLTQPDYDRLLWSCDLNFVRGEDSFVRAQWAGQPFVWHIYPQDDGAHAAKLNAFLDRHLASLASLSYPAGASPLDPAALRTWWLGWNGLGPLPAQLPALAPWAEHTRAWREQLQKHSDLSTQLLGFVAEWR